MKPCIASSLDGFDCAIMNKANDDHHAEDIRRVIGPGGMDDDIPF